MLGVDDRDDAVERVKRLSSSSIASEWAIISTALVSRRPQRGLGLGSGLGLGLAPVSLRPRRRSAPLERGRPGWSKAVALAAVARAEGRTTSCHWGLYGSCVPPEYVEQPLSEAVRPRRPGHGEEEGAAL